MNPADAGHDVVVKCGLTADQYVWLRDRAEALGLSQSAYLRMLLQADRRAHARGHLGAAEHPADSAGAGPERAE
jgi:hypothetical protein